MKSYLSLPALFFLLPPLLARAQAPTYAHKADTDTDPAQWVNPFIGTSNGGHAFAGATLPWGSVKAGADSRSGDNQAGYVSDGSPITGISQLHDDGTGGSSSLGHFQLLPLTSGECAGNDLAKCTVDREKRALGHGEPSAEPGYFGIPLSNGVHAEVTVTPHTALHRFTYPAGTERMMLLVDVTSDLAMRYQGGGGVRVSTHSGGEGNGKGKGGHTRVNGSGRWIPSFGQGTYGVFFCLDAPGLSSASSSGTEGQGGEAQYFYKQGRDAAFLALNTSSASSSTQGGKEEVLYDTQIAAGTGPAGVLLSFPVSSSSSNAAHAPPSKGTTGTEGVGGESTLEVRIGVSWTSTEKACAYAEEEVPEFGNEGKEGEEAFERVKRDARAKWNSVLNTISVSPPPTPPARPSTPTKSPNATLELFWTSLYRAYIAPTNVTGDNPLWDDEEEGGGGGEGYWDSFYCIWDTFRTVHPLYALTAPRAQAEILRAVLGIYKHTGWLPDCRMSTNKGFTQGGSNADSLLSDGYVKGIGLGPSYSQHGQSIDWDTALVAMLKDATEMGDFEVQGRGGVNSRKKLGFVPAGDEDHPRSPGPNTRSASRLLEYAYNDFSIALVAQGLANSSSSPPHSSSTNVTLASLAAEYFAASHDWANIWNPNATHEGFSGFVQPRAGDGSWFLDGRYDHDGVFRPDHCSPVYGHNDCFLGGGGGEFYEASSWEYSFYVPHDMAALVEVMGGPETFSARLDKFFSAGFHDMGDEPGFLPTYLYNYVGQPVKTVDRVDATVAMWYNNSLNGLPGNDDSGSMGAYAVWSHLGFFPVAGQDTYLLNSPYFPKITIRNDATGALATIICNNFAPANRYIQSATLNGAPYTKNWIAHSFFSEGGTLVFEMGSGRESKWGTGSGDVPMSLSTGGLGAGVGATASGGEGEGGPKGGVVDVDVEEGKGGVESDGPNGFWSYLIFLLLAD
ncbi:glycosyl hydrolase family 92-domain-containing protein [Mycena vitilis]|nr:glycosyl hydrolase family 92-domain-containing protein [Mycena vitilis]